MSSESDSPASPASSRPRILEDMAQDPEYVQNLLQSLDQQILVVDTEQNVVVWNSRMEKLFPPGAEAAGKPLSGLFPRLWEEYRGKVYGHMLAEEVIGKGERLDILRYPWRSAHGRNRYFDIRITPLQDRKGRILGAILVMNDVTDRVSLEDQLLRNAKTSSLADLGASVAHEIRNPLNSISLNIQLVKEYLENPNRCSREELLEIVSNALSEIKRMNDIIRCFLDFSRPPTPQFQLQDPNLSIRKALLLLSEQARQARVRIVEDLGDLPDLWIDQNQLSQAVYNICLNAIQEMKKQGSGTLEVSSQLQKDYVILEVKDNGPGIRNREKLFDLFYTTKEEGSGLGLPIANKIVESHEGRIVAENNLDNGACFCIYLPLKPEQPVSQRSKAGFGSPGNVNGN